jgi:hypothetical protein
MAFGGLWPGRQLWVGLRGPRDQRRGRGSAEHRALAKMVTDWFSGCEIVLAIAPIRQQSARIGIGFALLALSILAVAGSSALALSATAVLSAVALLLVEHQPDRLVESAGTRAK